MFGGLAAEIAAQFKTEPRDIVKGTGCVDDERLPQWQVELADNFAAVSKSLIGAQTLEESFTAIVELALTTVAGAEHAGITLFNRGQFTTRAASSDVPLRVDAIQYELGSGPCVDAVLDDVVYRSGDLRTDTRWPEFGYRAATEVGVNSMLAFRLFLEDDDTLAGLNFYSTATDAFDGNARMTGSIFATHAAIAMAAASRHEHVTHLEQALEHSREIGIAVGILMTRRLLTSDQAFDLLRIASQHTHRKLRDIAADVAQTGTLDLPAIGEP